MTLAWELSELRTPECPLCRAYVREESCQAVFRRDGYLMAEWECQSCGVVFRREAEHEAPDTEKF